MPTRRQGGVGEVRGPLHRSRILLRVGCLGSLGI